ncbi:hypothetical protein CEXT_345521 [Caerostris extrusa]|uniref:Uncharacterized protein n=1 Tax=Caerostris extrusa TaxID=172846 RepID=A0AAV4R0N9_CAEEX|nr:hypothetical protein CEXT_345521 [Caerostris extrusa]
MVPWYTVNVDSDAFQVLVVSGFLAAGQGRAKISAAALLWGGKVVVAKKEQTIFGRNMLDRHLSSTVSFLNIFFLPPDLPAQFVSQLSDAEKLYTRVFSLTAVPTGLLQRRVTEPD